MAGKKPEEEKVIKMSISMHPEDHAHLVDYCRREDRPMAWVMRKALRAWFAQHDEDYRPKK